MTRDEVKKALRDYLPAKRALAAVRLTAARIEGDAASLRAISFTGLPHGTEIANPTADAAERILRVADRLAASAAHYAGRMELAERLIGLADDADGQTIMRLRWVEDVGFDFIPARVNMDRRTMFRHYDKAIFEITLKVDTECH